MEEEQLAHQPATDEELCLPRATIQKILQDLIPEDMVIAKETRDLIHDCCVGKCNQSISI
jgi:hypothetical protein